MYLILFDHTLPQWGPTGVGNFLKINEKEPPSTMRLVSELSSGSLGETSESPHIARWSRNTHRRQMVIANSCGRNQCHGQSMRRLLQFGQ